MFTFDIAMTSRIRSIKLTLIDEMKTNRKQNLRKTSSDINVEITVFVFYDTKPFVIIMKAENE